MKQQEIDIFKDTPTYAEIVCKRIYGYCQQHNEPKRIKRTLSIKDVIKNIET